MLDLLDMSSMQFPTWFDINSNNANNALLRNQIDHIHIPMGHIYIKSNRIGAFSFCFCFLLFIIKHFFSQTHFRKINIIQILNLLHERPHIPITWEGNIQCLILQYFTSGMNSSRPLIAKGTYMCIENRLPSPTTMRSDHTMIHTYPNLGNYEFP